MVYDRVIEFLQMVIREDIEAGDIVSMFLPMQRRSWKKVTLAKPDITDADVSSLYQAIEEYKNRIVISDNARAERRIRSVLYEKMREQQNDKRKHKKKVRRKD